jgi:hypothetical protein
MRCAGRRATIPRERATDFAVSLFFCQHSFFCGRLTPNLDYFFLVFTAIYIVDVAVRSFGLGWSSFRANGWNLFDVFASVGSFMTTAVVQSGSTGYAIEQLQKLFLVSIAFKLVQRTDSLNKLFKTSVYVYACSSRTLR